MKLTSGFCTSFRRLSKDPLFVLFNHGPIQYSEQSCCTTSCLLLSPLSSLLSMSTPFESPYTRTMTSSSSTVKSPLSQEVLPTEDKYRGAVVEVILGIQMDTVRILICLYPPYRTCNSLQPLPCQRLKPYHERLNSLTNETFHTFRTSSIVSFVLSNMHPLGPMLIS